MVQVPRNLTNFSSSESLSPTFKDKDGKEKVNIKQYIHGTLKRKSVLDSPYTTSVSKTPMINELQLLFLYFTNRRKQRRVRRG